MAWSSGSSTICVRSTVTLSPWPTTIGVGVRRGGRFLAGWIVIGIVRVEESAEASSEAPSRTVKDTEALPEAVSGALSVMCVESWSEAESRPPLNFTEEASVMIGERELSRTST